MKFDEFCLDKGLIDVTVFLEREIKFCYRFREFINSDQHPDTILDEPYHDSSFLNFLNLYSVGRTLKAGDDAKIEILNLIRDFKRTDDIAGDIERLAKLIKDKELSATTKNGFVNPISFSSKILFIQNPDKSIPYDKYVVSTLNLMAKSIGKSGVKDVKEYYEMVEIVKKRFQESDSKIIKDYLSWTKDQSIYLENSIDYLKINFDELILMRLMDKYLWYLSPENEYTNENLKRSKPVSMEFFTL